jgi:hypothetical protein
MYKCIKNIKLSTYIVLTSVKVNLKCVWQEAYRSKPLYAGIKGTSSSSAAFIHKKHTSFSHVHNTNIIKHIHSLKQK